MNNRPANCQSYQERDGTHYCNRCGLRWDNDSIDPPDCLEDVQSKGRALRTNKPAPVIIPQAKQDEINRKGMAGLREVLDK